MHYINKLALKLYLDIKCKCLIGKKLTKLEDKTKLSEEKRLLQ